MGCTSFLVEAHIPATPAWALGDKMDEDTEDMLNYLKHKAIVTEKKLKDLEMLLGRLYEQNENTQRILLNVQKKVGK